MATSREGSFARGVRAPCAVHPSQRESGKNGHGVEWRAVGNDESWSARSISSTIRSGLCWSIVTNGACNFINLRRPVFGGFSGWEDTCDSKRPMPPALRNRAG